MTPPSLQPQRRTDQLEEQLLELRRRDEWRECVALDSPPGPRIRVDGRDYLHLCSNNYLDLAAHPALAEAAAAAARRWGTGSGAARLITGTTAEALALEKELAEFKNAEAALLFSSGYMANIGLIQALARRGDWLVCDELNHASLIDAARLSRAEVRVFPHNDVRAAAELLEQAPAEARRFILTEGVFSMDGDLAPLAELSNLALEHEAWLVVDDAHGTGVVGPEGRGACAAAGVAGEHVVQIVTLSKSLGSQGGAVVGSRLLIQTLMNAARSFIFETALAPPAVAAARAALGIVLREPERRARLGENALLLRRGLTELGFELPQGAVTPIFPIVLGENARALRAAAELRGLGYWVTPIRPPTVPEGTARLRVTVMSGHDPQDLEAFLSALRDVPARD